MAYKLLDNAEVKEWNARYEELTNAILAEQNEVEKAKLTAQQQALGTQLEEHLNGISRALKAYFKQHFDKVDNWARLSEQTIGAARKAAADYKKDTTQDVPTQLTQAVENLRLWEDAIGQDGTEMGAAWRLYRADSDMNKFPSKYKSAFQAVRNKLMDEQKVVTNKRAKIQAYLAEAQGLVKVTAKVTMKAGIKAGTGEQRPVEDAIKDAKALAVDMAAELEKVNNPPNTETAPNTIRTTKQSIREFSTDRTHIKNSANVTLLTSRKNLIKTGLKLMKTRVAGMEKTLALRTRAFRKSELAVREVKDEIKKANKSLKDAQTALKETEGHATKALAYAATLEARWKSQK